MNLLRSAGYLKVALVGIEQAAAPDGRLNASRDRTDPMEIPSRPMTELLTRRSGLMRWLLAGAFGLALHAGALWWLIPSDDPAAALATSEAMVMIDLPPEPELPPLESVEQAAVEEVVEAAPEELAERPPEPELAETPPRPEEVETVEPVEDLADAPPEPVETPLSEPEMLPAVGGGDTAAAPTAAGNGRNDRGEAQARAQEARTQEAGAEKATAGEADATGRRAGCGAGGRARGGRCAGRLSQLRSAGHCRQAPGERRRRCHCRATASLSIGRDGSIIGLSVGGGPGRCRRR